MQVLIAMVSLLLATPWPLRGSAHLELTTPLCRHGTGSLSVLLLVAARRLAMGSGLLV